MSFDSARYRQGYSIGAGGIALAGEKALLVRMGYGAHLNQWAIPGGFVEPGETVDVTIQREVLEETGINTEVRGLIAVRSRVSPDENSAYFVFLLRALSEDAHADGGEVLDARFFTLAEVRALTEITPMSRLLVTRALAGELRVLEYTPLPAYPASEFVLFL
jgi:ADP-ribose pyrophosphatase YjhB (NUDIX family)